MGCWMELTNDAGQRVRIKVEDGDIVFPKDSAGKTALAEGKFTKTELTHEQALAQARKPPKKPTCKFDPSKVKGDDDAVPDPKSPTAGFRHHGLTPGVVSNFSSRKARVSGQQLVGIVVIVHRFT